MQFRSLLTTACCRPDNHEHNISSTNSVRAMGLQLTGAVYAAKAEQENEWGNGNVLVDLKEHGGDISVSKDNVDEYIQVAVAV